MIKNLVIVESPAKAKTIEKYLGKDFTVKSCNGHVRDLAPNKLSIIVEKGFFPEYQVLKEKVKLIKDLKDAVKNTETVWLATDEDREGEAISWHLAELLGLDTAKTRRIVFHEITKNAILKAIETPREIDLHLVDAQQARRVLDRLVGFKISPILWQKVKPALSAGRVQSVAVRLIVEREREIVKFNSRSYYKVTAEFYPEGENSKSAAVIRAELSTRFDEYSQAKSFLNDCIAASFKISDIETKSSKRSPAPPFITSTLQQEASRKLGYSVLQTMRLAQSLYEAGHITYMRTDSVKLSDLAMQAAKDTIIEVFGKNYSQPRNFETKSKNAQEAHEAIRPTEMSAQSLKTSSQESKLYELIWKRTIASQMADAQLEKTNINIDISNNPNRFIASGEVIKFDGFLKLYIESTDDENNEDGNDILPPVKAGQLLGLIKSTATERFTRPPARYSEAALVKKMEELGIGRPSTYAPIISTIQKREYVIKENKPGKDRPYNILTLKNNKISEESKTENFGAEKGKLFPSSIGMIVNDFLMENFSVIMDFNFTAKVEDEIDEVALGKEKWQKMIGDFYKDFEPVLNQTIKEAEKQTGERSLGIDAKSGKPVYVKLGKYGSFVQLGDKTEDDKPRYAKLKKGQLIETITMEEALELLELPKELGNFEESPVVVNIGKFGPYVLHDKKFCAIPKTDDPYTIDIERAIEIIVSKREADKNKNINIFVHGKEDVKVLNGRFGPYISYKKLSYKIPKGTDPQTVTLESALEIIKEADANPKPVKRSRFTKK